MRFRLVAAAILAVWLGLSVAAQGHTRDQVFSTWRVNGETVTATIRLPARLASAYGSGAPTTSELADHFVGTMTVSRGETECMAEPYAASRAGRGDTVILDLAWICGGTAPDVPIPHRLTIRIDSLFGRFPNHVHFARLHMARGELDEGVFTWANRQYTAEMNSALDQRRPWFEVSLAYLGLGTTHILAGADHLAFVLGLMLIATGLRPLLFIVTGFTLGHSLTLGLAATNLVTPVSAVVEALIGFTVAIVAVEAAVRMRERRGSGIAAALPMAGIALGGLVFGSSLPAITWVGLVAFTACYLALAERSRGSRWAVVVAGAFGLVHGFGFAGVLQEIGLPDGRLVPALLGFNIGVELGQLLMVAAGLGLAAVTARFWPPEARQWGQQALAATLCGLGTFWFVSRAFAG